MSHNMTSSYDASTDTLTVGLVNTDTSGNILENEYAGTPSNIGVDVQDFIVYRWFNTSNKPSSVSVSKFTPNWSNKDRLPLLTSSLSIFFTNSIGLQLSANGKIVTSDQVAPLAIGSLIQAALRRSQSLQSQIQNQ